MAKSQVKTTDLQRIFLIYGEKVYLKDHSVERHRIPTDGKYINAVSNHFLKRLKHDIQTGNADYLLQEGKEKSNTNDVSMSYGRLRPFFMSLKTGKNTTTFKSDIRNALVRIIAGNNSITWEAYLLELKRKNKAAGNFKSNFFNTTWDFYYFERVTSSSTHLHSYYLARTVVNFLEPTLDDFLKPEGCKIELLHRKSIFSGDLTTNVMEDPNLCQILANRQNLNTKENNGYKLVINLISHSQSSTEFCEGIMMTFHSGNNCILGNFVLFVKRNKGKRALEYKTFHHLSKEYVSNIPKVVQKYFEKVSKNRFYSSTSGLLGTENRLNQWSYAKNRTINSSFEYDIFISAPYTSLHHSHEVHVGRDYSIEIGQFRFSQMRKITEAFQIDIQQLFGDTRELSTYNYWQEHKNKSYDQIEKILDKTGKGKPIGKESFYYAKTFDLCKATICFLPYDTNTDAYLEVAWSLKENKPTILFYGENVSLPSYFLPKQNWIREHYLPLKLELNGQNQENYPFQLQNEEQKFTLYRFIAEKVYKFSEAELSMLLGDTQESFLKSIPSYDNE